jgi:two-component system, sensor histidine kinase
MFFSSAEGAIWGSAAFALNTPGQLDQLLVIAVIASSVACGAVAAFGSYIPAFYALYFPAAVPYLIAFAARNEPLGRVMIIMALLHITAFTALAAWLNVNFLETIRLRLESLDLIEDLRREKEAAEEANVSKSRFLAAASHDLRLSMRSACLWVHSAGAP